MVDRVIATGAARGLIAVLENRHGPLVFHQSGGCCDGSVPMCFAQGEFKLGAQDVLMGEIVGAPFYMSRDQFVYWQHTQLIIDVVSGRGASFSLEIPEGVRFLTRSRVFTDAELEEIERGASCSDHELQIAPDAMVKLG